MSSSECAWGWSLAIKYSDDESWCLVPLFTGYSNGQAVPLEFSSCTSKVEPFLLGQHKTRWAHYPQEEPCEVFVLPVNKIHLGFGTGAVCGGFTGIYQTCVSGGDKARRQQEGSGCALWIQCVLCEGFFLRCCCLPSQWEMLCRELLIVSTLSWYQEELNDCDSFVFSVPAHPWGTEAVLRKHGVQQGGGGSEGTHTHLDPSVLLRAVGLWRGGGRETLTQLFTRQKWLKNESWFYPVWEMTGSSLKRQVNKAVAWWSHRPSLCPCPLETGTSQALPWHQCRFCTLNIPLFPWLLTWISHFIVHHLGLHAVPAQHQETSVGSLPRLLSLLRRLVLILLNFFGNHAVSLCCQVWRLQ